MPSGIRDKVALATGAGSGIGRATALALAHEGARLAVVERGGRAIVNTASPPTGKPS